MEDLAPERGTAAGLGHSSSFFAEFAITMFSSAHLRATGLDALSLCKGDSATQCRTM